MITKEDIQNLANLARIEITQKEAESLTSEIDSILGYVGKINPVRDREGQQRVSVSNGIKEISGDSSNEKPILRNVLREDVVTHKEREYTEDILRLAPSREKDYLKVKKILG